MRNEIASLNIPSDLEPLFPARVISGVQPSGAGLHLGNYFGAVQECTRLQYEYPGDAFYLIADYHALTSQRHPDVLLESTQSLALDCLAVGVNPDLSTLYRQSDVPQVCELMWVLACATRKTKLDGAKAYNSAIESGNLPTIGLFLYPALMAADILALRGTEIPVGDDQAQHVEIACEMARSFNRQWSQIFPIPRRRQTAAPTLRGVDGRKMSKSIANVLPVFWTDEEDFEARVMHIVTGSVPGDPVHPESTPVFQIYQLVADTEKAHDMRERIERSQLNYGEAKHMLLDALRNYFAPYHARRRALQTERAVIEEILYAGAQRVSEETETTLDLVRQCVGLSTYRRRAFRSG